MLSPVPFTERLLDSLFGNPDEVRAFVVTRLEHGLDLAAQLPGPNVPTQQYLVRLCEHLFQRGELTWTHFFGALATNFPNRAADIRVVAHQVERRALGGWLARDLESKYAREAVENFTRILGITGPELYEHAIKSEPGATIRTTFADRWPTREELADWTLDKIRGLKFAADCAELLDMPRVAFEAGIADGQGHIILRKAFPGKFPQPPSTSAPASLAPSPAPIAPVPGAKPAVSPTSALSTLDRDIGSLTAKEARQRDLAPTIAFMIGANPVHVEKTLAGVHGRNYIRNLFWDDWPEDDRIGDMSVAEARRHHILGTIASITGLGFMHVRDRIQGLGTAPADLERPLRTVFANEWPVYESENDDSDSTIPDLDYEKMTVDEAINSLHEEDIRDAIGYLTNTRAKQVAAALSAAPRTFRVRDVFATSWPSQDDWMQMSVSSLRRYALQTTLARRFGWPIEALKSSLADEHGNTLLGKLVHVRTPNATKISLGDLTLAEVDRRDLRERLTLFLVDKGYLQQKGVTRRFNSNNGNARVRNVFSEVEADEWPEV